MHFFNLLDDVFMSTPVNLKNQTPIFPSFYRGLCVLAVGELFDRFCYYGILTVMILYLVKVFGFSDHQIYALSGVYSTLGFGLPLLGGLVADRLLGYRKAIILGASCTTIGNIILSIATDLIPIYLGLAFVVTGIGLFKGNVLSQVGTFYSHQDKRKEGAFAVFYLFMNIGALMGPIVFGLVVSFWGWHAGFILGAAGMGIGLILYLFHYRYFYVFLANLGESGKIKKIWELAVCAVVFLAIFIFGWMFKNPEYFSDIVWVFVVLTLGIIFAMFIRRDRSECKKLLLFLLFIFFSIFYFSASRQVNTSIELFLDRLVARNFLGWDIPTEWFSSVEPIFISISLIIIAPFWRKLVELGKQPSPYFLVIFGLFLGGLSLVIFGVSAWMTGLQGAYHDAVNLPLILLLIGYLVLGLGELAIFPSVTNLATDLAPKGLQSTFMGFWLLANAFSAYVGALMADLSVTNSKTGLNSMHHFSRQALALIYEKAFFEMALIVFIITLIAIISFIFLRKYIRSIN